MAERKLLLRFDVDYPGTAAALGRKMPSTLSSVDIEFTRLKTMDFTGAAESAFRAAVENLVSNANGFRFEEKSTESELELIVSQTGKFKVGNYHRNMGLENN